MKYDYDIVTIGSATVDLFADARSELIRIDSQLHHESLIAFPLGSKVLINQLEILTGGGGTNTATAFSRLDLRTAYLGKIGDDSNAAVIKQKLAEEGVDFIGGEGGVSGLSVVLNSPAHDRVILVYKGTNNTLAPEEVKPFTTRWIYLSSMMEQSLDTAQQLISQQNCKVAFNPSNYQAEKGYEALKGLIEHVDFLVMNREEVNKLFGLDYTLGIPVLDLFKRLRKLPPLLFAITDGSKGSYIYDRNVVYHAKPSEDLQVNETTGAGDAFASTFTAALAYDLDILQAIRWAVTNAESVLMHRGAKEKLLAHDELLAKIESKSFRIDIIANENELEDD